MAQSILADAELQVCVVVRDLEKARQKFGLLFGIEKFNVYTVDTRELAGVTYRGQPGDYRVTVAMAKIGSWHLELLVPERGSSIYQDFLDRHGEGVQHLGFFVNESYPAVVDDFTARGFEHLLGGPILGTKRNGRFDYYDTQEKMGVLLELLDMPDGPPR